MPNLPQKIDGAALAAEIAERLASEVAARHSPPRLIVFRVGDDAVSERFTRVKQKFARSVGAHFEEAHLSMDTSTETLRGMVAEVNTPCVVQLPLPKHIDTTLVLNSIPTERDVDVLSNESYARFVLRKNPMTPPVAGAVRSILQHIGWELSGKSAVVVGRGRLVGMPVAEWLRQKGAKVEVADILTADIGALTRTAQLIVSGAGTPHLITPDMVTDGTVLIDAGTSAGAGHGGALSGDIEPDCYAKSSYYTPVPGGVGPLTVACLFENVFLAE